jgi:hypothetical protein
LTDIAHLLGGETVLGYNFVNDSVPQLLASHLDRIVEDQRRAFEHDLLVEALPLNLVSDHLKHLVSLAHLRHHLIFKLNLLLGQKQTGDDRLNNVAQELGAYLKISLADARDLVGILDQEDSELIS